MTALTKIGILFFTVSVVLGPVYTVSDYSITSNLISELGAQHTKNNFIMIIAFVVLGGTIVIDGLKRFQAVLLPFMLFGLAMTVVGIFPHKPMDASLAYNAAFHDLHGILASVAGISITVGFIWQGFRTKQRQKLISFYMALVAVIFPVLMLGYPDYQGIIQRAMYLQILGWLWVYYPNAAQPQPKQ